MYSGANNLPKLSKDLWAKFFGEVFLSLLLLKIEIHFAKRIICIKTRINRDEVETIKGWRRLEKILNSDTEGKEFWNFNYRVKLQDWFLTPFRIPGTKFKKLKWLDKWVSFKFERRGFLEKKNERVIIFKWSSLALCILSPFKIKFVDPMKMNFLSWLWAKKVTFIAFSRQ